MLVIDLLDHTLEQWFKLCGRKFTLKTVGMIGVQLFDIAKHIHSKKYIHRDMKPENFMTSSVGGDRDVSRFLLFLNISVLVILSTCR